MGAKHFIAYIFLIKLIICTDFDSYEVNRIEFTPLHDAIIFKDIADIMNEFENNMFTELNSPVINFSESDEDIDDLLLEYQHYLDKAHKQRVGYIEKTKSKNKIPPLRHEKYSKLKPKTQTDDQTNYYFNMKHHTAPFFNAIQLPIRDYEDSMRDKTVIDLAPVISKPNYDPILSSCRCKVNQIPCKCPCKQCLIGFESGDLSQDKLLNSSNDRLSLRIKVDVQLPSLYELINAIKLHNYDKRDSLEWPTTKNILASINVPFPYSDFPIPVNTFDFRDNFLKGNSNVHKITIHKKKKSRSNGNKKHRGKKLFNFHHDDIEPKTHDNNTLISNQHDTDNKTLAINKTETKAVLPGNKSDTIETYGILNNSETDVSNVKLNNSFYTINLSMNISNGNSTEDTPKIENSIESDYDKDNITSGQPLRVRREIYNFSVLPIKAVIRNISNETEQINETFINKTRESRKSVINTDSLLLYWPNDIRTLPAPSRNITALIMEREAEKRKLNITHEAIRSNRTKALEQAIFGDVNWNDVDTVAPVFMSFVGKYIKGVLTFCSESVCHSMKCSEKVCTHRICKPENRYNQNGHCSGNNNTDSVANMESIMDLPSSVAFEIVDILQDNLSGKIYGKMTLCINSKCCTFVAAKKSFQKSKCTYKDIDASGHCKNLKNAKAM